MCHRKAIQQSTISCIWSRMQCSILTINVKLHYTVHCSFHRNRLRMGLQCTGHKVPKSHVVTESPVARGFLHSRVENDPVYLRNDILMSRVHDYCSSLCVKLSWPQQSRNQAALSCHAMQVWKKSLANHQYTQQLIKSTHNNLIASTSMLSV